MDNNACVHMYACMDGWRDRQIVVKNKLQAFQHLPQNVAAFPNQNSYNPRSSPMAS
jgi:hypothetical protein